MDGLNVDEDGEEGEQVDTMVSGDNGVFSFSNVKCGTYRLLPLYRDEHTTFDLHPASLVFDVKGSSVAIAEVFRVTGFSARGRVVQHAGAKGEVGVDGVVVTVYQDGSGGGERRKVYETTTAADGSYRLETMASATYTIEARRAHYHFEDLVALSITPRNCAQLPDIVLKSLDLCGSIVIDRPPPGVSVDATRSVELYAHKGADEAAAPLHTAHTKAHGAFCFHVPPGDYIVKPVIKAHEERNGLLLMPPSQFIHVDTAPILDVHFVQSRVKVSGRVSCIVSPCDGSITVVLAPQDQKTPKLTATLEAAAAKGGANEHHHTFVFRDVLPGRYELQISSTNWCWKQPSFKLEVRSEDLGDLAFVQTGFVLALTSSHATDAELSSSAAATRVIQVPKGSSHLCLEAPGTYTLVPKSCYRFEHTSYAFDTAAPAPVSLVVSHFQTRGSIAVSHAHSLPESLRVHVLSANAAASVIETAHRRRDGDAREQAPGEGVYDFVAWGKLGESITLRPETDGQLLFYPRTAHVTINKAECSSSELTSFQARPGLFLDGNVIPPIADVQITVRYAESSASKGSKASHDEDDIVVRTTTSSDGRFRAGPLYDDVKYLTDAYKAGFHFTVEDDQDAIPTTFRSVRLGRVQIAVTINGEPLGGVLALLSGANSYKGKDTTNLESGLVEFDGLFPGAYFVRPVLKEYEFEPRNVAFDVVEGTTKRIDFVATRTGYSCFGRVRSLTGEPEKTAVVEAVLLGGAHTEETQTDNAGNYRLRGLRPNAQYTIQLKASERIERTLPVSHLIATGTTDTRGIDFVLFKHSNAFDISGTLDTEPEFYSSLTVALSLCLSLSVMQSLPLSLTHPFALL